MQLQGTGRRLAIPTADTSLVTATPVAVCAAHGVPPQLYGRTKRDAFREWRQSARRLLRLKGILARVISRQLSMAWESWRQLVHDKHQRLEVSRPYHLPSAPAPLDTLSLLLACLLQGSL